MTSNQTKCSNNHPDSPRCHRDSDVCDWRPVVRLPAFANVRIPGRDTWHINSAFCRCNTCND